MTRSGDYGDDEVGVTTGVVGLRFFELRRRLLGDPRLRDYGDDEVGGLSINEKRRRLAPFWSLAFSLEGVCSAGVDEASVGSVR